ncbi:MAG: hypothetical protein ACKO9B_13160 [Planctomycetota bacterium]
MNRSEGSRGARVHGARHVSGGTGAARKRFAPGLLVVAALLLSTTTGCLIPIYSGDPIRRAQQLIFTSEDLRAIADEWERIWFLDSRRT